MQSEQKPSLYGKLLVWRQSHSEQQLLTKLLFLVLEVGSGCSLRPPKNQPTIEKDQEITLKDSWKGWKVEMSVKDWDDSIAVKAAGN